VNSLKGGEASTLSAAGMIKDLKEQATTSFPKSLKGDYGTRRKAKYNKNFLNPGFLKGGGGTALHALDAVKGGTKA